MAGFFRAGKGATFRRAPSARKKDLRRAGLFVHAVVLSAADRHVVVDCNVAESAASADSRLRAPAWRSRPASASERLAFARRLRASRGRSRCGLRTANAIVAPRCRPPAPTRTCALRGASAGLGALLAFGIARIADRALSCRPRRRLACADARAKRKPAGRRAFRRAASRRATSARSSPGRSPSTTPASRLASGARSRRSRPCRGSPSRSSSTISAAASFQPMWTSIISAERISRARIDVVLAGVLRRGAVRRLEHRDRVGQVGARARCRCRRPARRARRRCSRR